jgi:hypothetical protein
MIDKGSLVCSTFIGKLQMGTVTSRRVGKDKWAYYTVEWHNNEKYEEVLSNYRKLNPNGNYGRKEYKAGELFEVTSDEIISFANNHLDFINSSNTESVNG